MKDLTIYWFRNDLRIKDNAALSFASQHDNSAAIYIYDTEVILKEDFSQLHLDFINDSLLELRHYFNSKGSSLNIFHGNALDIIMKLNNEYNVRNLITHHETGNWAIRKRDDNILKYCNENGINWKKFQSNGVVIGLVQRDGWYKKWMYEMNRNVIKNPNVSEFLKLKDDVGILDFKKLNIRKIKYDKLYFGGERKAKDTLNSFLESRGQLYSNEMSSPLSAFSSCSRLSSYITYGNISIRQVFQTVLNRQKFLRENKIRNGWLKSLSSFSSRLKWHCHFVQKLEMQPNLEFTNMVRSFDGIRDEINQDRFIRWSDGTTGIPMIDACMRSLKANGWINFRMRAMLVSFASYNLWLDWRKTSKFLSKYFIDYEPGIHYNQFQMQSGVTGINAIRVYNPLKQQIDQDPDSTFVKRWVPELKNVPSDYIQHPHLLSENMQNKLDCVIGKNYPKPVVDVRISAMKAKKKIFEVKKTKEAKLQSKEAYLMHGSRRKNRTIKIF